MPGEEAAIMENSLIDRCRAFRVEVLNDRESLRAERESLREQLTAKIAEMTRRRRDRLQAFVDPGVGERWTAARLSPRAILCGYGVLRYRARTGHTKGVDEDPAKYFVLGGSD